MLSVLCVIFNKTQLNGINFDILTNQLRTNTKNIAKTTKKIDFLDKIPIINHKLIQY